MSTERVVTVVRGALMLPFTILIGVAGVAAIVVSFTSSAANDDQPVWLLFVAGLVAIVVFFVLTPGFFTLQPNESRVLVLFGNYRGTVRQGGFHWANPFYSNGTAGSPPPGGDDGSGAKPGKPGTKKTGAGGRFKVSLRARTFLGDKLKVNDRRGNPVEIAAMIVWHVQDTAQAVFDVDNYETYVTTQAETALRHIATAYSYDQGEDGAASEAEITLRGNPDEVSVTLREDLGTRLAAAGVVVDDARLTHLAYAPEIAQAMLRRQQAEAVIAARRKIVTGAVSMVEMALTQLEEKGVVELDNERRAAMVSNLLVVLCGEAEVTPVVNTGTLYQ
jgi:regulator of protease activity HflC (stomatin/prohibitin superfamily)